MKPGIYIHVPFCKTKCTYCNFNFVINYPKSLPKRYYDALLKEIECFKEKATEVDSIYFGGGTPSIVPAEHIQTILARCRDRFDVLEVSEITLEINPGTLTPEKARAYRRMGVNRASLGVQAFNDAQLRSVGRDHTTLEAIQSYALLRKQGFENINIDLILGLPGQSDASWTTNLETVRRLRPNHVSIYVLELDPDTRLGQDVYAGKTKLAEDEFVVDGYYQTIDYLAAEGYEHYEISNFSLPGCASRHNLKYWSDVPYYGFGAGSHSYLKGFRYHNERNLERYIQLIETKGNARVESIPINRERNLQEAVYLGLRTVCGIDVEKFQDRYHTNVLEKYAAPISKMVEMGLLTHEHNHLRLTRKGFILSNEVFQEFIQ